MTDSTAWLTRPISPEASRLLFCLPFAGGGASTFREWPAAFADSGVEVVPLQLPGRENRVAEDPAFSTPEVARVIADLADRPYAIFGHSMGGRLAYDAARHLLASGDRPPSLVVTSASRPPDLPRTGSLDGISTFSDARLTSRLRRSGSIPEAVLAEPDLMAIVLPVLRADFAWIDALDVHDPEPIPVPLLALAGALDRAVSHDQAAQWRAHTSAGFALQLLPGDHFFLRDHVRQIATNILQSWPSDASHEPAPTRRSPAPHHCSLGDNLLWTDAVVRSAGFPIEGLQRLNSADAATAADDFLSGRLSDTAWATAFAQALDDSATEVDGIAADPLLQEALAWQNPAAAAAALRLTAGMPMGDRRRRRDRQMIARYWQRYCAKNDTVGFFGPLTLAHLDPQQPTRVTPGPALVRERRTILECWAVQAVADTFFAEPSTRLLLSPRLAWNVLVDTPGRRACASPGPWVELSRTGIQALTLVDGTRPARELLHLLGLGTGAGVELLDHLQGQGLLRWGPEVPQDPTATAWLTSTLDRLTDHTELDAARDSWGRLLSAVDTAEQAGGSPSATDKALQELRDIFRELTGGPSSRAPGQTYAGRDVVYQDTVRDLDVTIGGDVLRPVERQLRMLTRAARWWCAQVGAAYTSQLSEVYDEQAAMDPVVPFSELWLVALAATVGSGESPTAAIEADFARRWDAVLGLDARPQTRADAADEVNSEIAIEMDIDQFEDRVTQHFPDSPILWSGARIHSPDLQIAASSVDRLQAGDCTVVLGEWHAGMATLDNASSVQSQPDPQQQRAALRHDLGGPVVRPLLPTTWARNTGRLVTYLQDEGDVWLAFTEAAPRPGGDIVQVSDLHVVRDDAGQLRVRTHPGSSSGQRDWPLLETLSGLLSIATVDGFRQLTDRPYTPRITVGAMALARRNWRTDIGSVPLWRGAGLAARFAAARRWCAENDFPERVFVSVGSETKPFFVDFRSPWLVGALATTLASGHESAGPDTKVVVSEMLPTTEQCWLPDRSGKTYCSELRLQVTDV
ncbi:thioesterase domain-containing protein [Flexivirga sp. B27]